MNSSIKLIVAGILIMVVSSCSETEERTDDNIQTIYENNAKKGIESPSLLDDNLVRVDRIGTENSISREIRGELKGAGIQSEDLDLGSLKRFHYNYTQCNLYSIQHKNGCEKTIVYEYDGLYLIAQAKLEAISDTVRLFELHTSDGQLCFSVEISDSNRIGDIKTIENNRLDGFRLSVSNQLQQNSMLKGTNVILCRQTGSWSACFNCSMEFCATRWYCSLAVAAYPLEFIAGWAASCIGA